jgi:hypothetical protein
MRRFLRWVLEFMVVEGHMDDDRSGAVIAEIKKLIP